MTAPAKKPVPPTEKETKIEGKKAAPATKAAAPAEATEEKAAPKPRGKFALTDVITLHLDHNPKRPGTTGHSHFEMYEDGMTVEAALTAGISRADLAWDSKHDFLEIGPTFNDDAEKRSKPVKAVKEPKAPKEPKTEAAPAAPKVPSTPAAKKKAAAAPVVEEEEEEEEE